MRDMFDPPALLLLPPPPLPPPAALRMTAQRRRSSRTTSCEERKMAMMHCDPRARERHPHFATGKTARRAGKAFQSRSRGL